MNSRAPKSNIEFVTERCPVCGQPLAIERSGSPVAAHCALYCAYGPCLSQAANDGAWGESVQEAYKRLCELCEKEEDREDA